MLHYVLENFIDNLQKIRNVNELGNCETAKRDLKKEPNCNSSNYGNMSKRSRQTELVFIKPFLGVQNIDRSKIK